MSCQNWLTISKTKLAARASIAQKFNHEKEPLSQAMASIFIHVDDLMLASLICRARLSNNEKTAVSCRDNCCSYRNNCSSCRTCWLPLGSVGRVVGARSFTRELLQCCRQPPIILQYHLCCLFAPHLRGSCSIKSSKNLKSSCISHTIIRPALLPTDNTNILRKEA